MTDGKYSTAKQGPSMHLILSTPICLFARRCPAFTGDEGAPVVVFTGDSLRISPKIV